MNKSIIGSLGLAVATLAMGVGYQAKADSGPELYQKLCVSCHVPEGRPTAAPPIFAVKNHVLSAYPNRQDFVNYVVAWVAKPNVEATLMPGAVRKFGLMPAFPYDSEEVRQVAEFIYDSDLRLPEWYKQHYEEEHGEAPKE